MEAIKRTYRKSYCCNNKEELKEHHFMVHLETFKRRPKYIY